MLEPHQVSWPKRSWCRRWLPWGEAWPVACALWGGLCGAATLQGFGRFGTSTADLRSLQRVKVLASSCKELGNPTWKGLGWESLHHPTERAACVGLGAAARCRAGGFTEAPRLPRAAALPFCRRFVSGSNFAPGMDQEGCARLMGFPCLLTPFHCVPCSQDSSMKT